MWIGTRIAKLYFCHQLLFTYSPLVQGNFVGLCEDIMNVPASSSVLVPAT